MTAAAARPVADSAEGILDRGSDAGMAIGANL
jgi:hypothetical protein